MKSTAVLKYANIETPAWFQELQRNTNLNNPPSSWSHGSRSWEKYIRNMSGQEHLPFSRFHSLMFLSLAILSRENIDFGLGKPEAKYSRMIAVEIFALNLVSRLG